MVAKVIRELKLASRIKIFLTTGPSQQFILPVHYDNND